MPATPRLVVLMTVAALAASAGAQTNRPPAVIAPATPTNHDLIAARFTVPSNCSVSSETNVTGNLIRTTTSLTNCIGGPPPFDFLEIVSFGPLAPGSYGYEIYIADEGVPPELRSSQELLVLQALAPATVPAASAGFRIALVVALAFVACLALRPQGF